MASLLGMIAAGFAFAGSGKIVNELFPGDRIDHAEEIKRHNMAMEEYTRDRESYNKEMSELAYQEHQRDRNQRAAEMEHGKSVQSIKVYNKESEPPKPPMLENYLKKYNVYGNGNDSGTGDKRVIFTIVACTSIVGTLYLYGKHRRHGQVEQG